MRPRALLAGVAGTLAANLVLVRRAFGPLEHLTRLMHKVDPLVPGRRLRVDAGTARKLRELPDAFSAMLERLEDERRESARRALLAQEAERRRVARELHDELGQTITGVLLRIDEAIRSPQHADLEEAREDARRSLDDVRRIARDLSSRSSPRPARRSRSRRRWSSARKRSRTTATGSSRSSGCTTAPSSRATRSAAVSSASDRRGGVLTRFRAVRRAAILVAMAILVWSMVGLAFWHFAVLVPDRFHGGIVGAFLAAWIGALVTGFLLPAPGIPTANPPGVGEAVWAIPGALVALGASYWHGARRFPGR